MGFIEKFKRTFIGDRAFYGRVFRILIPIIIQNTITNIVSLLDNVMVGAVGTLQMSAVAIVNQLLFIFNLCIFGGLAGAGIFSAQYAGAKDNDGVAHCFRMKLYLSIAMLIIALIVLFTIPTQLISMYLAEDTSPADAAATLEYGLSYLSVMMVGLLPFAITQAYGGTLRELGETKVPMIASVTAILVNLVFNYILIFGNEGLPFLPFKPMGVVGAAIATVLSRFVETAMIVIFTHRHKDKFQFIKTVYKSPKVPIPLLRDIAKRGTPLLINEFFWSSGMALLMQCYSVRGLDVVAAFNISSTAANLFNVVFLSMGNAVAIMVGQQLGANKIEEAKSSVWRIMALSITGCFVMGTLMCIAAPFIPLIYNTTDHVRSMATSFLMVVAFMMPFHAFSHCCYFTLRSGGKTLITMFFDCGFTWGVAYPVAFALANFTSMPIVPLYFLVQGLELIKCTIGISLVRKGVWINNIVENI